MIIIEDLIYQYERHSYFLLQCVYVSELIIKVHNIKDGNIYIEVILLVML